MKKSILFIVLLIIASMTMLMMPLQAAETIRITNGEWPPYLSEHSKYYGAASRIVTEAFAQEGIKVQYGFFPWKRSLSMARDGEWDGSAVWFYSPEREQDFYISNPVINVEYVFFHLKEKPFKWKDINDLRSPLRIGATLEYNYGPKFEEAEKAGQIKVERIPDDEQNFVKLMAGRIDVFPMDKVVGSYMIRKKFTAEEAKKITFNSLPVRAEPLYLVLSKKNPRNKQFIDSFNKGLEKLKKSGKINRYQEEARTGKYD